MPKRRKPLTGRWTDPELHSCAAKASKAAGATKLTDGDIQFLAQLVCDQTHLLDGYPIGDENGNYPPPKKRDISAEHGQTLGWIFFRDPVGAAKAVAAAHKEASRINTTKSWAVRRAIRWLSLINSLPHLRRKSFDNQAIVQAVKEQSGFTGVSEKLIQKAFDAERAFRRSQGF